MAEDTATTLTGKGVEWSGLFVFTQVRLKVKLYVHCIFFKIQTVCAVKRSSIVAASIFPSVHPPTFTAVSKLVPQLPEKPGYFSACTVKVVSYSGRC